MLEKDACRFVSPFADFYTNLHHFVLMQCKHFVQTEKCNQTQCTLLPAHLEKKKKRKRNVEYWTLYALVVA